VDIAAHLIGVLLLAVTCVLGLASMLLGIPGTFIIFAAGMLYGLLTNFATVTYARLAWLLGMAVFAEGLELLSSGWGYRGVRPTRRTTGWAVMGSFIGGIVGTPILFGVGSLLGALGGAFAGAALAVASEGGEAGAALRSGLAALRGRLAGLAVKLAIGVAMVIVLFAGVL
jgi:hypothetical protein